MPLHKQIRAAIALGALSIATNLMAQTSTSKSMSFEDCLKTIRVTASNLGVAPINVVETNDMRMVRFKTSDGSVLVTCSRPDNKMVMTISK